MTDLDEDEASRGHGLFGRLIGRNRRAGAAEELRALVADAERIGDLTREDVRKIGEKHGVDLTRRFRTVRKDLYRRFLEECLLDHALSERETEELARLRRILHLEPRDAAECHDRVGRAVYGDAVAVVLEDHRLDEEEERFLRRLQEDLALDPEVASEMLARGRRRARERFVSGSMVHENIYVTSQGAIIEFEGVSETSFEDAVRSALDEACRAVPELSDAELSGLRVALADGTVEAWRVTMRARVPRA